MYHAPSFSISGALGIARSLIYSGQVGEPLYAVDEENRIYKGEDMENLLGLE